MITIDRRSSAPIFEQLVKQLRYLIAVGHFDPREPLPSTRSLASSLGISFHTVRKAYQVLERQGILEAAVGTGYRISDPAPLGRADRLERGAEIMSESLQQLVGLGLSESEIEYLVDEQLGLLETRKSSADVAFFSSSLEIAEQGAASVGRSLQRKVQPLTEGRGVTRSFPDYVITEFRDLSTVRGLFPGSEVIGVSTHIAPAALDSVARLLGTETLGLLARDVDSIRYLSGRLRRESGFNGQIVATSATDEGLDLAEFFQGVGLLAFTPATARRVRTFRGGAVATVAITVVPDQDSLASVLESMPTG